MNEVIIQTIKSFIHIFLNQGSAFLAHLDLLFYGMPLFIVGGDVLAMKIIRETSEIKVFFSSSFKL
jgi:hypothetical protein